MNNTKVFIRDIHYIFSIGGKGKKEKLYIKRLIEMINDYESDYPNVTYNKLIDKFGTPKDIYIDYLETVDSKYLLDKLRTKKLIRNTCLVIIVICSLLGLWKGYLIYSDSKESENQRPTHIEITKPEEISNEKISD